MLSASTISASVLSRLGAMVNSSVSSHSIMERLKRLIPCSSIGDSSPMVEGVVASCSRCSSSSTRQRACCFNEASLSSHSECGSSLDAVAGQEALQVLVLP